MAPLDRVEEIRRAASAVITAWKETMRIRMTTTREAAPDGVTVMRLLEGETYDLPAAFANRSIERGFATAAAATEGDDVHDEKKPAEAPASEEKDAGAAPENRAEGAAPQNKATERTAARRRQRATRR